MSGNDGDETQRPSLVPFPEQRDEIKATLEKTSRSIDAIADYQKSIARIRRALFVALVAEGFTEQQALELCWR